VDAHEIVVHEVQCHGRFVVASFFENALMSRVNLRMAMCIVRF
jgi:hypothetical protein